MTIGIYGRGLANRAGIGRYTRELLRAVLATPTEHRFRVFLGEGLTDEYRALLGETMTPLGGGGDRLREEQIFLPAQIRKLNIGLFHNPDFTLPLRFPKTVPAVVTVHDVAYVRLPDSNSVKSKLLLNAFVPSSLRRAKAIIAVSEFTKKEIVEVYGTDPAKIHVIPNGIEERFSPAPQTEIEALRTRLGLPRERVVLYLGGIEPRKNVVRLAEAVAKLPHATLAIAGGKNRGAEEILAQASAKLGDRLRVLGFVPDEDLPALYGAATVFAYPSIYEGFGIPPVEAMACGTPVVSSNAASLPEAVGNAAETFNPFEVDEIAEKVGLLLDDESRRAALSEAGFAQAAKFRWSEIAQRTIRLYEAQV